jgi:hypothetical protein
MIELVGGLADLMVTDVIGCGSFIDSSIGKRLAFPRFSGSRGRFPELFLAPVRNLSVNVP